jgi:hypothetical protein
MKVFILGDGICGKQVFGLSQGTQVVSKILVRETGLLFLLFTTPVIQPIPLA